jgi:glycosyltransferase involved in cell wall biosynthesis
LVAGCGTHPENYHLPDKTLQKTILRSAYRHALGAATLAMLPFRQRRELAVYYAGAGAGDAGGPLVKVKLLERKFPQAFPGYSLIYMLSNAIYLPQFVVERLVGAGVPIVLNQNGVFYKAWYPEGWQRENERMAGPHRMASYVFYQSEFCRMCAHRFLGPRSGASEILYNGVDTDAFTPRERSEVGRPFTFLVTGRIGAATAHRLKSSVQGLAAARKGGLDCVLKVAGGVDDDVCSEIASEIDRLGVADHVSFTGAYHHVQAPNVYRSADAYLMTKHNDPCPNAVLEALATGLPVLYSSSGGVPELVGDDAGIGLPVEQTFDYPAVPAADDIAKGMEAILRGSDQMSKAARTRAVERFSLSHWYARHEAVFNKLLGGSLQ